MTARWRGAVGIVAIVLASNGVTLFWTEHSSAVTQVRQERAGRAVEQKLCTTLDALGGLRPPTGNPAGNPSRAYLQQEHAILAQLAVDVGCPASVRGSAR